MSEVRRSVSALRADTREDQPLEAAIAALVEDFRQGTGISTSTGLIYLLLYRRKSSRP